MRNNVNDFNVSKASEIVSSFRGSDSDKIESLKASLRYVQQQHNLLIDILQREIKILQADIANGITVSESGAVALGLASSSATGAISLTDWSTFNNKCSKEEAIAYAIALGG
jgi:hypothetical protein